MKPDLNTARVFIRPGYTDLRKALNGLTIIIEQEMTGEVFSGNLYIFCNRERKLIKAIWWDKTGFWLNQKRLEKDKYPWPETKEAVLELSAENLTMLLSGIDIFKAHKPVIFNKVS